MEKMKRQSTSFLLSSCDVLLLSESNVRLVSNGGYRKQKENRTGKDERLSREIRDEAIKREGERENLVFFVCCGELEPHLPLIRALK